MPSVLRNRAAFTLIELILAILVFLIGIMSAYSLLQTATSVSLRSRDEIVGGNLLRERLELVKNVRDSNWMGGRDWNSLRSHVETVSDDPAFCGASGRPSDCAINPGYYAVENAYGTPESPVRIRKLAFVPDRNRIVSEANGTVAPQLRLCLDPKGRYSHDCSPGNEKTPFYAYLKVSEATAKDASGNPVTVSGALSLSAFFVSTDSGYRTLDMHTVITDWKR